MKKEKKKKKMLGTADKPKIVYSKTNRFVCVQAIDNSDNSSRTLLFLSTRENDSKKNFSKKNKSEIIILANRFSEELKKKGFKDVVFDRNGNKYCGNIKVFCEQLREKDIKI